MICHRLTVIVDQLKVAHTTLEQVTRSLKHKDEQIEMLSDNSRKRAKDNKRLLAALSAMQKDGKLEVLVTITIVCSHLSNRICN